MQIFATIATIPELHQPGAPVLSGLILGGLAVAEPAPVVQAVVVPVEGEDDVFEVADPAVPLAPPAVDGYDSLVVIEDPATPLSPFTPYNVDQLGAWDKSSAIRFVSNFFVHFTGFEGEYPLVFNRKTREMGGKRRYKDGGGTFVLSSSIPSLSKTDLPRLQGLIFRQWVT